MSKSIIYSIPEVCERTGFSRSFIYLEIERGRLASFKDGRNRRVRAEDIPRWLKTHKPGQLKAIKAGKERERNRAALERANGPVFNNCAFRNWTKEGEFGYNF